VSHHPPISCYNLEGLNYEVERQFETEQHFTGKGIKVNDKNKSEVHLKLPNGKRETYLSKEPMMIVGNLFMGTTYIEPQGQQVITSQDTNISCSIEYRARSGWTTKPEHENYVTAVIRDRYGKDCYMIAGRYTKELSGIDLRTGAVTVLFKALEKP
jgi:hypothetical protein